MHPWEGIVQVPEGKSGNFEIRHFRTPAGCPVMAGSLRTALFRGQANKSFIFDHETVWYELLEDGARWMSDLPIEQIQIDEELEGFEGRVLVGGLGLGYAVNVLAARKEVTRIFVVEISEDVIKLAAPYIKDPDDKVTILCMDLLDYLNVHKEYAKEDADVHYDYAFYDIWESDGEGTFHKLVCPLRQLSDGWIDNVVCWNESVMRGQLLMALQGRWAMICCSSETIGALSLEGKAASPLKNLIEANDLTRLATGITGPGAIYVNWAVPFWKAVQEGLVNGVNFQNVAARYAKIYGLADWELEWGVVRSSLSRLREGA